MNKQFTTTSQIPGNGPQAKSSLLPQLCSCSPEDALALLQSSKEGLTEEQAETRREQYGLNEVSHEKPPTWYAQLFHAFITPFNGVLFAVSVVSLFSDVIFAAPEDRSFRTIIVLLTMVLLSTLLRFWQEFRSNKAAEELKALVTSTTAVLRAGMERSQELPIASLVPGDIVHLSAGDMIPADVRVLSAKDLFVSQAMLTGESIPLEKHAMPPKGSAGEQAKSVLERETACFMGTNVVSGTATAVVAATGDATHFGAMAKDIVGARPLTSFDKGISKVSWMLVRFLMVMTPLVFLINGISKGDWLQSLLFAVSVAVGLTPEMLPMIVTTNLAKGAVTMARRKTIVKRLNAIQNFGAMDILCTDKTGTLTQNKIILERHLDIHGHDDLAVLEFAWLNSSNQTGLKNLLDVAVLDYALQNEIIDKLKHFKKVDEIPFDFIRRRMSVIVRNGDNRNLLICKGAIEEVLPLCTCAHDQNVIQNDGVVPFTKDMGKNVRRITRKLNQDGLRAIAVAYKWLPPEDRTYSVDDEKDLVLSGYLAFLDPPKESAREAIAALRDHGVAVKIITGDNEVVTRKICKEVGLPIDHAIVGQDLEKLSDDALQEVAERATIFAKMAPVQKSRVIRALQKNGHTVGYLGDGINDAAALKDADVGISVDTAVDIAKESADIILLEKSLLVLEEAVVEGRRTFANIIKYIKMTASSNFGNVFSVLIASIFLPFLPMLPIQLLVQNLLYDISQVSIPWDDVDQDYLKQPRKWDAGGIARFMLFIGPISSIFDVITYLVMWHVFGANSVEHQALFQSAWFIEGLLTQTLIVHMIRTQHVPFIESRAAMPVILLTASIMAFGIFLPFSAFGAHLGMVALPPSYFAWLAAILLSYCLLTQVVKVAYIRRFKQWL